jgi:hypothetical protein
MFCFPEAFPIINQDALSVILTVIRNRTIFVAANIILNLIIQEKNLLFLINSAI